MAEHKGHDVLDDKEFERLFSALDDVKASEELKATTLAAIFAQAETCEETTVAGKTRPILELVEDDKVARRQQAGADETASPSATPDAANHGVKVSSTKKKSLINLRIAAALLVLALAVGGGVA